MGCFCFGFVFAFVAVVVGLGFFFFFLSIYLTLPIWFRLLNWKKINPIEKERDQRADRQKKGKGRGGKGREPERGMSLVGG